MFKRLARFSTLLILIGGALGLAACGGNPTPSPTPSVALTALPTFLPPAPTAPPLTAVPTAVLPTAVLPTEPPAPIPVTATSAPASASGAATKIPTALNSGAPKPTSAPAASGSPATLVPEGPLTGLTVHALRFEPSYPQKLEPISFYATIENRTGKEQYYPICVEIFRPGEAKSFGISDCRTLTIVPGTAEIFAGTWTASGIKECIPVRARAILREADQDDVRLVLPPASGGELWSDFNVCP